MNVLITPPAGAQSAVNTGYENSGITFSHVEINGGRRTPSIVGIIGGGYSADALNIHGTGDGIDLSSTVTVQDSWIHDLMVATGDHTDGVQSAGTSGDVVKHNTIDATESGGFANSAVIIGADSADMGTVTISNNLMAGGNYTAYAGADPGHSSGTITFTGNRFVMDAQYGPCSFAASSGHVIGFGGNVLDSNGAGLSC